MSEPFAHKIKVPRRTRLECLLQPTEKSNLDFTRWMMTWALDIE